MKNIKTSSYTKLNGKTERGKRDGTGPFEGSNQDKNFPRGKRKMREENCPFEKDEKDKEKDN